MADIYTVTTAEIATGTAVKTLLEIEGPATRPRLEILEVAVTFEGVTVTGTPIEVELVTKSADGTGSASPPSPVPDDDSAPASAVTVRHNMTAEGTVDFIKRRWKIHPQSGIIYPFPLGEPIKLAAAKTFGLRVTSATDVGSITYFKWRE